MNPILKEAPKEYKRHHAKWEFGEVSEANET